ncbi:ATP-binding cassette domain-containing protein [Halioxenophilus sp. WMMB6]|uniref:ATP-binding cassette domain-containing protein n=1 Tax=Halioxenophilus sp. WMMB6 TaxID=3073815 RepID=UPI00295E5874|nr:ATP-binding cassette domain-containing protein [Halioxenophilus sp. WMMB6]
MINLNQIRIQRGTKVLLEQASLRIYPGHKIGVIGANGCGKSTLFKLLLGELTSDSGDLAIPAHWRIAHMAQETKTSASSALDFVIDGDTELRQLEQAIETEADGERLSHHYARMEEIDGYSATARASQLLSGLGFIAADFNRPVNDFSGGWRIRLNLAQALMTPSDLLLLDEPTNHLDLDTTLWLEQWLQSYRGTLLIISHDRDFLDNVVQEIVNFENSQLFLYSGNYSSYERQKAERLAQQQQAFEKQQQRISEIDNFVRRFRAKASKAKQAQSRMKELERMVKIAPAHIDSPFSFHIPCADKISTPLLSLSQAAAGYGGQATLSHINWNITVDTRIGLLGANGAGKSTLIKTLTGDLPLLAGSRVAGEHLRIGYYHQHQMEALDLDASCLLHIQRLSPNAREQDIRNYLGSFGFLGDRALESIRHFSGGEKARLALSLIAWQKPNLLLLDEPTNHLDLEVRHALTMALQEFEGAVVVISHDRHLLRNTVDEFLLVHDGRVDTFDGSLEDYQTWLKQANKSEPAPSQAPTSKASKADKKEARQQAAQLREQQKPLTQKLKKLEREIEQLNAKLADIEQQLADPALYNEAEQADRLQALLQQQSSQRSALEACEEQWLETSEALENFSL